MAAAVLTPRVRLMAVCDRVRESDTEVGVYIEHFTTGSTFQRMRIGPNVNIITAGHPLDPSQRRAVTIGKPIVIERNVWIAAGATIIGGLTVDPRSHHSAEDRPGDRPRRLGGVDRLHLHHHAPHGRTGLGDRAGAQSSPVPRRRRHGGAAPRPLPHVVADLPWHPRRWSPSVLAAGAVAAGRRPTRLRRAIGRAWPQPVHARAAAERPWLPRAPLRLFELPRRQRNGCVHQLLAAGDDAAEAGHLAVSAAEYRHPPVPGQ